MYKCIIAFSISVPLYKYEYPQVRVQCILLTRNIVMYRPTGTVSGFC